jgi:hypothetical protein
LPDYGCSISSEKRLTNFDVALSAEDLVVPFQDPGDFPWCGLTINTQTLEVKAATSIYSDSGECRSQVWISLSLREVIREIFPVDIANKLTVQHHRKPGKSFISAMMRSVSCY